MEAHSGYLTIKKSSRLTTKTYTSCWCVLYCGKGSIPPRLEICDEKPKTGNPVSKKSIDIVDAKWGKADTLEPAFCFVIKNRYVFVTNSREECDTWFKILCCISPDLFASRKALNLSGADELMGNDDAVVMQDNCLYASNVSVSVFDVVGDQGSSCRRFGFTGLLNLCFDSQTIKLMNGNHLLAEWNYYSIRSFGSSKHTLSVTMGTKSSTGEGTFSFMTIEGETMVQLIALQTKRLNEQKKMGQANLLQGENHTHVPTVGLKDSKSGSLSSNSSTSSKKKPAPAIPSPKPVSPLPDHSPAAGYANSFDAQFKKQLSETIGTTGGDGKQQLERKISNNSVHLLNESIGKKEGKKALKEKEKITKQMKKEDKKLAKEKEKQEKERQKQLEKPKKNEGKSKEKPPIPKKKKSFFQDAGENEYSEAYDHPQIEGDYAECNFEARNYTSNERKEESKLYDKPWGPLSIPVIQSNPENNTDNDYDETEELYSSPKKDMDKPHVAIIEEEESYEPFGIGGPPPIIPPKFDSAGNDDDSNNNVYNHFVESSQSQSQPENVYGLESARVLNNSFKSKPFKPAPVSHSDVYETVE